jgi:hypothetical protein
MGVKETDSLRLQKEVCREFRNYSRSADWRLEVSRKQLRLDSIPPDGNSGMNASKKLELPPTTRKDGLQAPGKKSGSTVKKEKPKQMPPKVKGAELWQDCPAEFLAAAKAGRVSARISIPSTSFGTSPGPGLILKEIKPDSFIRKSEGSAISKKIGFASKKLSNNRPKPNRTLPKLKGKSK